MCGMPGRAPRCSETAAPCTTRSGADPAEARHECSGRGIRLVVVGVFARRLLREVPPVPLGPVVAARLPTGRLRGRVDTADLAPRARRPVAGPARRDGGP